MSSCNLSQILVHILNGCVLVADSSHLAHPLVLPALKCLRYVLDPDVYPLTDVSFPSLAMATSTHPPPPDPMDSLSCTIRKTAELQRDSLSSLLDPSLLTLDPLTIDPSVLAREELAGCCFEEHDLAAQVLVGHRESLLALDAVHAALRKRQSGSSEDCADPSFDPLKEYANVAVLCTQDKIVLSQQKLMTVADGMDFAGELESMGVACGCGILFAGEYSSMVLYRGGEPP